MGRFACSECIANRKAAFSQDICILEDVWIIIKVVWKWWIGYTKVYQQKIGVTVNL